MHTTVIRAADLREDGGVVRKRAFGTRLTSPILFWRYVFQDFRWPRCPVIRVFMNSCQKNALTAAARFLVAESIVSETPEQC